MAKKKTSETEANVIDFIHSFLDNVQKKKESFQLIEFMQQWSGFKPKMWGPSIIGFGSYHYKYDSGYKGDAPLIGFSPRRAAFSLYVYAPNEAQKPYLNKLGKYKMGKSCIYVKKLSDIDIVILKEICLETIHYLCNKYDCPSIGK